MSRRGLVVVLSAGCELGGILLLLGGAVMGAGERLVTGAILILAGAVWGLVARMDEPVGVVDGENP